MFRLHAEDFTKTGFLALWGTLAFQAGFINAFGFLACGRYVSHVTGFGTQIGVALTHDDAVFAIEMLGIPLSFILGAFLNGVLTSARLERGLMPRFDIVVFLIPLVLASLLILGQYGDFGEFGEDLSSARDFVLLFSLSGVCGMQNGCFAVMTHGQIRTTHLTGISTDIGTDVARSLFGKLSGAALSRAHRLNLSRVVTVLSFAFGSIVSVLATRHLKYEALIVPLITSVVVSFVARSISANLSSRTPDVGISESRKLGA